MTTTVSNKLNDVENRFNALTSKQQQDAEVIDARADFKGVAFNSLKERIDYTDKLLRDSTISTITTESDFTQQDAEVIDARADFKGVAFNSLKERIDYTDKLLRDSTISTITTESDFTTVEATSNGYFEDVKLEGRTLVNLVEDIPFSYSAKYSNIQFKKWQMLKPSTEYTFVLLGDFTNARDIFIGDNSTTEVILPRGNYGQVFTFTTPSNINKFTKAMSIFVYKNNVDLTETQVAGWKLLILEGDHTQNPPSYFEGLKSVGQDVDEISVESVDGDGNLVEYIELNGVNSGNGKYRRF